jgi:hypothetical protein
MQKWGPMIDVGEKISSRETKKALAQIFENTAEEFEKNGLLTESGLARADVLGGSPVNMKDGTSAGYLKGKFGRAKAEKPSASNDFYLPNVIMPMLRRIFPSLIAHELVGVQAMNGPVGYALAYRAKYGHNGGVGHLTADSFDPAEGYNEIGFNPVDARYTGTQDPTAGLTSLTADDGSDLTAAWAAYCGPDATAKEHSPEKGSNSWAGVAQETGAAEYARFSNGTYPTVAFDFIKTMVEARTRKLGAGWSPELAEDMEAMHGFDVESEFVNMISYEIGAEIDRQLVTEMVKAALTGGSVSKWSPAEADGLDQMGRLATLLTQVTIEANQIALKTRRGHANFVITSPRVTALLEQLSFNKFVSIQNTSKDAPSVPDSGVGALTKCGFINDSQQLLIRDTYAVGDYVLMGYKGAHPADNGIIYCPYIPVQLQKVINPDTLTPVVGARTRYGVMNSVWDAKNYYHFITIKDLTTPYTFGDNRHFIQEYKPVTNGTLFV